MLRCPKCGADIDPREARAESDWTEILRLLPELGAHGRLAWEYVELFGVRPIRMKPAKILRRLQEVARLLREERFVYQKKTYTISKGGIQEALREVCNRTFESPLTNDNYLKRVMIGISERERKEGRDRLDREQRERETQKAPGVRPRTMEDAGNGSSLSSGEISRRAKELADKIGGIS